MELKVGNQTCLQFSLNRKCVMLDPKHRLPSEKQTNFKFSHVFDPSSSQQDVYNVSARPILDSVLKGYNGTIIAYG